ncbi:MAG: GNAT family N-acetyltransferase [Muribaculaceae bacterium]|nr:GNAT family N-acetyltransferase [Muribaculaceae bacterium]
MKLKEVLTEKTRKLYREAFPPEERRQEDMMIVGDDRFHFLTLLDEKNAELGLLSLWSFPDFNYIEHFAIFPELRGNGLGSEALRLVSDPVILEIEPPESGPQAACRLEFYLRNGFRILDYDYVQPPYSPGFPSLPLLLMARGNIRRSPAEIAGILHRIVYNKLD